MIIFGWGYVTEKDYGPTMAVRCPNCNNDAWWHLYLYRKWFTLFFIPVIPYESKHVLLCKVCSSGVELKREQVEQGQRLNELTYSFLSKQLRGTEYRHEADKLSLLQ